MADRVRFDVRDITDPGLTGRYDLVAGFEMLHDLARPVEALPRCGACSPTAGRS